MRRSFSEVPRAEVLFNYYGKLDEPDDLPSSSFFGAARESSGNTHHPEGVRYYPLAIASNIHFEGTWRTVAFGTASDPRTS